MNWKGILQLAVGALVWGGAIIAACFGFWLPLIGVAGATALVFAAFAGPSIWERYKKGRQEV